MSAARTSPDSRPSRASHCDGRARTATLPLLAFVHVGDRGEVSIARLAEDLDGLLWWCGDAAGWVSPHSDGWDLVGPQNVVFDTLDAALGFARAEGWC